MEQTYWLGRERASLKMAQGASSAEARLVHYELAGRYSVNAASAATGSAPGPSRFGRSISADEGADNE